MLRKRAICNKGGLAEVVQMVCSWAACASLRDGLLSCSGMPVDSTAAAPGTLPQVISPPPLKPVLRRVFAAAVLRELAVAPGALEDLLPLSAAKQVCWLAVTFFFPASLLIDGLWLLFQK